MNSALYLLPFIAWVGVKRSRADVQWKAIVDAGLIGYVAICFVALLAGVHR